MLDDLFNELSAQARMQIIAAAAKRRVHYRILNVGAVILVCCLLAISIILRR
jgi:hypothetical protein